MRAMVTRLVPVGKPSVEEREFLKNAAAPTEPELLKALGEDAAHPGMYFVLDDETQAIVEPAWLYLLAHFRFAGLRTESNPEPSFADSRQTAYRLCEWLNFMSALRRDWKKANHETLMAYATYQMSRISPHSGKRRDPDTIGSKLGTVYSFYAYTNGVGLTQVRWDPSAIAARFRGNRRRHAPEDEQVRPFGHDEVPRIRAALGPLPSELHGTSERSTRDRLLFETAVLTGMRGEELCYLKASAIRKLKPDPDRPNATQPLRIQVTKGRVHRTVALPNRIASELKLYIEGERSRSVARSSEHQRKDHGYLFVNFDDASKPGGQLKTNTIHRRFAATMRNVGLATEKVRMVDGVKTKRMIPDHSFHDTRHTFAVRYFVGLKKQLINNPAALNFAEPWEVVQFALGHADWHTTRKYYLNHVGAYEAAISDRVHGWLGEL
jgi:integrase